MTKPFRFLAALCLLALTATNAMTGPVCARPAAKARSGTDSRKQLFDYDWKFYKGDAPEAAASDYNDKTWRNVSLPHDWSIEGRPDKANPSGNDGGYYPTGTAWYRKTFTLPAATAGKRTALYFEGVYMNSDVYVNGQRAGGHPYGYSSFLVDITPLVRTGRNTVAVRVDNSQQKNCRWYSGSGIYRHVWLVETAPVHLEWQSVAVTTPEVSAEKAVVKVAATVTNNGSTTTDVAVKTRIMKNGRAVAVIDGGKVTLKAGESRQVSGETAVGNPQLWSIDTPERYSAEVSIIENGKTVDRTTEKFGIRSITFSAADGLRLNGQPLKLSGGCLHHDNGLLGAAAFDRAEQRKAVLMKRAGFNAARTSHNPPSEAFLDACDSLGLLVIDEAFDGWRDSKNKHDYATLFDQWAAKDIEAMVRRDRNHPSIFCWSIGNEVIERKKLEVVTTARMLADAVKRFDTTRPVTSALASWDKDWEIYDPLAAEHDIVGYNYMLHKAESDHRRVPSRVMMQTESYPRDAFSNWQLVSKNNYIIGDFVWTAIDYLGESGIGRYYYEGQTPGEHYSREQYPWHGAYCGDIDLTGWRKPVSHYREMLYNPQKKLYMAVREPDGYHGRIKTTMWAVWPTWESWTWTGHEGKNIDVEVCSRYPLVRLYLNDRLVGEQKTGEATGFKAVFSMPYEPGRLVAEGVEGGSVKERATLQTAGKPAVIAAAADRTTLKADGEDLAFIEVELKDDKGTVVPEAAEALTVKVTGAATLAAAGNADLTDGTLPAAAIHKTWKGRALVVVKSGRKAGNATVSISGQHLKMAVVKLSVRK